MLVLFLCTCICLYVSYVVLVKKKSNNKTMYKFKINLIRRTKSHTYRAVSLNTHKFETNQTTFNILTKNSFFLFFIQENDNILF